MAERLPSGVKAYAFSVLAMAVVGVVVVGFEGPVPHLALLIVWTAATAVTASMPVSWWWRGTESDSKATADEVFAVVAVLVSGVAVAVALRVVSHLIGHVIGARIGDRVLHDRLSPSRIAYHAGQAGLATMAAAAAPHLVATHPIEHTSWRGLLAIVAAIVGYLVVSETLHAILLRILGSPWTDIRDFLNIHGVWTYVFVTALVVVVGTATHVGVVAGVAASIGAVILIATQSASARRAFVGERTQRALRQFIRDAAEAPNGEGVRALLEPLGRYLLDGEIEVSEEADGRLRLRFRHDATSLRRTSRSWEKTVLPLVEEMSVPLINAAMGRERDRLAADHDALTGLLSRRGFDRDAARLLERLAMNGECATLFYIDLNFFKQVNDQISHDAGDGVLVETSNRLRLCVRPTDLVARRGGDEFAVFMIGEARGQADRIRAALRDLPHGVSGAVGVTSFPTDGTTVDELLRIADQRMYEDKRTSGSAQGDERRDPGRRTHEPSAAGSDVFRADPVEAVGRDFSAGATR